ncbi:MAG: hypothetical protein AAFU79_03005, partial [Myxococcota bacterium]
MQTTIKLAAVAVATLHVSCGEEVVIVPPLPLVAQVEATSAQCPTGGVVIQTGLDANGDGALGGDEVSEERLVCNGPEGAPGEPGSDGLVTLVLRQDEPPGPNCENGGERFDVGLDQDGNGTLESSEIGTTTYVCRGSRGVDAPRLLTVTDEEVGSDCTNGGTRVRVGLDANRDMVLTDDEVELTRFVCAADDGQSQLTLVDQIGPGADCAAGGQRIQSGLDENRDGLLQGSEVTEVDFVCAPLSVLTEVTPLVFGDATCPSGGQRVDSGVDLDASGTLEAPEVTSTSFACNGADGRRVLTSR